MLGAILVFTLGTSWPSRQGMEKKSKKPRCHQQSKSSEERFLQFKKSEWKAREGRF